MVFWDECFGRDADEVFAYTTTKKVWIRDRRIGAFYYVMAFFVVLYVFIFQILYMNEHFELMPVQGLPRMFATHPTKENCDPMYPECKSDYRSLHDLIYCNQYLGKGAGKNKAPCVYMDGNTAGLESTVDNKYFIPTAREIITERRRCRPSRANGFTCDNEYEEIPGKNCLKNGNRLCTERDKKTDQYFYIADVKNFIVQFQSSYEQGKVHGTSLEHPGNYAICKKLERDKNETHDWYERMEYQSERFCSSSEYELYEIPCKDGNECKSRTEFDFGRDTGLDKHVDKVKRFKDEALRPITPRNQANKDEQVLFANQDEEPGKILKGSRRLRRLQNPQRHKRQSISLEQEQAHAHDELRPRVTRTHPTESRWSHLEEEVMREAQALETGTDEEVRNVTTRFHALAPMHHLSGQRHKGAPRDNDMIGQQQFSTAWGDSFRVGRILQLAGADLDADFNFDGWTTRQSGTVIQVRAIYNNMYPFLSSFGYHPVEYWYEFSELPVPYMSHSALARDQPEDYPETRVYEVTYGVMIWFKVGGSFGVFSIPYFLLMLVTAFAMMATATTLTDIISTHLHPRKDNFFRLKYDVSSHFSDTWKCPKCGFFNSVDAVECKGTEAWASQEHAFQCKCQRPADLLTVRELREIEKKEEEARRKAAEHKREEALANLAKGVGRMGGAVTAGVGAAYEKTTAGVGAAVGATTAAGKAVAHGVVDVTQKTAGAVGDIATKTTSAGQGIVSHTSGALGRLRRQSSSVGGEDASSPRAEATPSTSQPPSGSDAAEAAADPPAIDTPGEEHTPGAPSPGGGPPSLGGPA